MSLLRQCSLHTDRSGMYKISAKKIFRLVTTPTDLCEVDVTWKVQQMKHFLIFYVLADGEVFFSRNLAMRWERRASHSSSAFGVPRVLTASQWSNDAHPFGTSFGQRLHLELGGKVAFAAPLAKAPPSSSVWNCKCHSKFVVVGINMGVLNFGIRSTVSTWLLYASRLLS